MAVLLPVAFTVGRPPKLGFVKDHDDDLIDVGENEDEKAWMPFRDVVYLAIRAAQARTGRQTAVASANGPIVTTGSPLRPRKPASSTTCAVSDAPDRRSCQETPMPANAAKGSKPLMTLLLRHYHASDREALSCLVKAPSSSAT